MLTKKFWLYGFGVHAGLVVSIAVSAYLGILPTHYKVIPYSDFWGHMILIGMLAFFLDGACDFRPLLPERLPWLRRGPVIILSIAALEELAQTLSPYRTVSLKDLAADVTGICLGAWLAKRLSLRDVAVNQA